MSDKASDKQQEKMNTDIRKNYHGCQNCVHQPEPLRTCDRILELDYFVARCPFWVEKKGGMRNEHEANRR